MFTYIWNKISHADRDFSFHAGIRSNISDHFMAKYNVGSHQNACLRSSLNYIETIDLLPYNATARLLHLSTQVSERQYANNRSLAI